MDSWGLVEQAQKRMVGRGTVQDQRPLVSQAPGTPLCHIPSPSEPRLGLALCRE